MTTFSKVQSASNFADPAAVTLGAAPTEGNLLIGVLSQRAGTAHADHVLEDTEGGWTKIADASNDQELADANARQSCSVWWKPVTASTPDTFSGDDGTTNSKRLTVVEYAPDGAYTFGVAGAKSANSGTGSSSPLGSGNTGSIASSDLLLIGGGCWRMQTLGGFGAGPLASPLTSGGVTAQGGDNGIAHLIDFAAAGQAAGVKSTSLGWSGSGHEAICWLAAFEDTAGGGTPVGLATETDTAGSVTALKTREVGLAAEADSAQAATALKSREAGLAVEVDSAFAFTVVVGTLIGQALETDTANALGRDKLKEIALPGTVDTAFAVTPAFGTPIGQAAETDTAQPVIAAKSREPGLAAETDAAQPVTAVKELAIAIAVEADTAQPALHVRALTAGIAAETDTALALTADKLREIGIAIETDTAIPVTYEGQPTGQRERHDRLWIGPGVGV